VSDIRRCPQCNARIDDETGITGANAPYDGAISICMYCSGISVFTNSPYTVGGLALRPATTDELDQCLRDPKIKQLLALIAQKRADGTLPTPREWEAGA
jgi:hypothetical protein